MTAPTVFADRYQVARPLARGGMAEVYLATDTRLDRPVAVKVMHAELAANTAFVERFEREARAMAGLNHPNMVRVYDYGTDSDSPYIVMEYVRGKTLRELLHDSGMPPPDRAAEVIADVAGALQYAHENGIVHRDVKPGNIMIDTDGTVKVTDFGIAQAPGEDAQQLTQVGAVVGTAAYFSPEQAQGKAADARSDVYAMGCVLYELITGSTPFEGETPWAIAYQHVNDPMAPPSTRNPRVPRDLELITMRAVAKDPNQRYQSAAEMRIDLQRFVHGEAPLYAGTVVPAATQAALMTSHMDAVPPVGPGDGPVGEQVPERRNPLPAILGVILVVAAVAVGAFLLVRALTGGDGGRVEIPDVVGKPATEARVILETAGLVVEVLSEPSDDVPTGRVIRTDPRAGVVAARGDTVKVFASAGAADVSVPDVVEKNKEEARRILEEAGFVVDVRTEKSPLEIDLVVSQDPAAGSQAAKGSTVTLVVSAGPDQVTVPDVVGESKATATASLRSVGFDVSVIEQASDAAEGTVLSQLPGGGSKANPGSKVTLTVAVKKKVTVPLVTGKPQSAAEGEVSNAGLSPSVQMIPDPGGCAVGNVCSQDPAAGSSVAKGSTVKLFVRMPDPTTTTTTAPPTTAAPTSAPPTSGP